jgi:hypothetical protein
MRGTANQVTYILHDDSQNRWCGYSSKERWTTEFREVEADTLGYVERSQGRISQINLRETAITGDWVVDDTYTVSATEQLIELNRTVSYFSENEQRRQRFSIRDRKATLIYGEIFDLNTGKPLQSPRLNTKFDKWPMFVRFSDLPFNALLSRLDEIQNKGISCVSSGLVR